jgi:hypothetical protein
MLPPEAVLKFIVYTGELSALPGSTRSRPRAAAKRQKTNAPASTKVQGVVI